MLGAVPIITRLPFFSPQRRYRFVSEIWIMIFAFVVEVAGVHTPLIVVVNEVPCLFVVQSLFSWENWFLNILNPSQIHL